MIVHHNRTNIPFTIHYSVEGGQGVCERTSKGDELDSEGGLQVKFHDNNLFDKHLLMTDKT